jgi:hypothetical protein
VAYTGIDNKSINRNKCSFASVNFVKQSYFK